jgi:menaquinone-specific isochorismate synthase
MTATSSAVGLVARTREVAPGHDLLDALAPDGFAWLTDSTGFVTAGVAARVPATRVEEALASVKVDDDIRRAGSGAIAVGALPFHDAAAGELVIPARVTGISADGRAWVTEIGPTSDVPPARRIAPTRYVVESRMTRAAWRQSVDALLREIAAGRLEKAVLAREVLVTVDEELDARTVLERLRRTQGASYVFAAAGLVGASPELLVRRRGASVVSRPMAGTVARAGTPEADAAAVAGLANSPKNASEHRLVVEAVVRGLQSCGVEIDSVGAPELAHLTDVSHLATSIDGRAVHEPRPSALAIAIALHPTPAVGGTPREVALEALRELESFDRDRYAGPVGWVDADGDGEWAVALRCADLDGNHARLFAGAGIVAGSDPDAEWDETEAKLEPMLRAIVRP